MLSNWNASDLLSSQLKRSQPNIWCNSCAEIPLPFNPVLQSAEVSWIWCHCVHLFMNVKTVLLHWLIMICKLAYGVQVKNINRDVLPSASRMICSHLTYSNELNGREECCFSKWKYEDKRIVGAVADKSVGALSKTNLNSRKKILWEHFPVKLNNRTWFAFHFPFAWDAIREGLRCSSRTNVHETDQPLNAGIYVREDVARSDELRRRLHRIDVG